MHTLSEKEARDLVASGVGRPMPRSTFANLRADTRESFPLPVKIRGRLFWDPTEIDNWLTSRPRVAMLPARRRKERRESSILTEPERRAAA